MPVCPECRSDQVCVEENHEWCVDCGWVGRFHSGREELEMSPSWWEEYE